MKRLYVWLVVIVVMCGLHLQVSAAEIDPDIGADTGSNIVFEDNLLSYEDKSLREVVLKYPPEVNKSISLSLSVNGTEILSFLDTMGDETDLSKNPANVDIHTASGIVSLQGYTVDTEGLRRVARITLKFSKGCKVSYNIDSNLTTDYANRTGSFTVSLQEGDEGDIESDVRISFRDVGSNKRIVVADWVGNIDDWQYIMWRCWSDTNRNLKFEDSEQIAFEQLTFNSTYTQVSWVQYKVDSLNWPNPKAQISLSNTWSDGFLPLPSAITVGIDTLPPIISEPAGILGRTCSVMVDEAVPFEIMVDYQGDFGVSYKLVKIGNDNDPFIEDDTYLQNASVRASMDKTSGSITMSESGHYRLDAILTNDRGRSFQMFIDVRVIPKPTATLKHRGGTVTGYDWTWQLGQRVEITALGTGANDYLGSNRDPVVWDLDTFTIQPLNGQPLSSIHVMDATGKGQLTGIQSSGRVWFKNTPLANIALTDSVDQSGNQVMNHYRSFGFTNAGQYRLEYTCTTERGNTAKVSQVISIVEPIPPTIQANTESKHYRDPKDQNYATIKVIGPRVEDLNQEGIVVSSGDGSALGMLQVTLTYDGDNNGVFGGDADKSVVFTQPEQTINGITCKIDTLVQWSGIRVFEVTIRTKQLGRYQVHLSCNKLLPDNILPGIDVADIPPAETDVTTEVDNTPPSALYAANPLAKVDVVFALGKLDNKKQLLDLSETLETKLNSAGNYLDAHVESVKTETIDMSAFGAEQIFNTWEKIPRRAGGSPYKGDGRANPWTLNVGKGAIYTDLAKKVGRNQTAVYDPTGFETTDFVMEYDAYTDGRHLNAGLGATGENGWGGHSYGSWFRLQQYMTSEGKMLRGYILVHKASGWRAPYNGIMLALCKVENVEEEMWGKHYSGGHFFPMTAKLANTSGRQNAIDIAWGGENFSFGYNTVNAKPTSYRVGSWYTAEYNGHRSMMKPLYVVGMPDYPSGKRFKIECAGNNIKIYLNDTLMIDYTDTDSPYMDGTYGVWSGSSPDIYYANFAVTRGGTRTLAQALNDVAWRDNSDRFVIHATDIVPDEFSDFSSPEFSEQLRAILDNDAYLANLGSSANEVVMRKFGDLLKSPSGEVRDKFIYNTPATSAVDKTGDWIIEIEKAKTKPSRFLLLNSKVAWNMTYTDQESDIAFDLTPGFDSVNSLLAEKWRFRHDASFFDNGSNRISWDSQWIPEAPDIFTSVGQYRVNYKRKDNPLNPSSSISDLFSQYRYWSTDYDPSLEGDSGLVKDPGDVILKDNIVSKAVTWSWDQVEVGTSTESDKISISNTSAHAISVGDTVIKSGESGEVTLTGFKKASGVKASDVSDVTAALSGDSNIRVSWASPASLYTGDYEIEAWFLDEKGEKNTKVGPTTIKVKRYSKPSKYSIKEKTNVLRDTTSTSTSFGVAELRLTKTYKVFAGYLLPDGSELESNGVKVPLSIKLFFSGRGVDDTGSGRENMSLHIPIMDNDVFDKRYPVPDVVSAAVIEGNAVVNVVKSDTITDTVYSSKYDWGLQIIPATGWSGTLKIEYKYALVREDLPVMSAMVTVDITSVNDPPVAGTVPADATRGFQKSNSYIIEIPTSVLLRYVTDPDSPPSDLSIDKVEAPSSGTVKLVGDKVVVESARGFTGIIYFRYVATDGLLGSNYGTVAVEVLPVKRTALALDDSIELQLVNGKYVRDVLSNDEFEAGLTMQIKEYSPVLLNGVSTDAIKVSTRSSNGRPFCVIEIVDAASISSSMTARFSYRLTSQDDSNIDSTAFVYLSFADSEVDGLVDNEGYIWVHRKPVALFSLSRQVVGNKVVSASISDGQEMSYDSDHSVSDLTWSSDKPYSWQGIRAWEWAIRVADQGWDAEIFDASDFGGSAKDARSAGISWMNSKLQDYKNSGKFNNSAVYVSLRVRDIDGENSLGVWSQSFTQMVTNFDVPPVALFKLNSEVFWFDTKAQFTRDFNLIDYAYSPAGLPLIKWQWEFVDNADSSRKIEGSNSIVSSSNAKATIVDRLGELITSSYSNENAEFKLRLTVTDSMGRDSEPFAVTFRIYKKNKAPVVNDKDGSQVSSLDSSFLYEIDEGLDGIVGDDWGTASNSSKRGVIDFPGLLSITDDQPDTLTVSWQLAGQSAKKRSDFNEGITPRVEKFYPDLKVGQRPFTHTVTEEGMLPGAYKVTAMVKDNPNELIFGDNSGEITVWGTESSKRPYHLFVVPSLSAIPHSRFEGWFDQTTQLDTGKRFDEVGLEQADIVPCAGDEFTLIADTNQYVDSVKIFRDLNKNGVFDGSDDCEVEMAQAGINSDGTIRWEGVVVMEDIPDPVEGEELTKIDFVYEINTTWGSESGSSTRSKKRVYTILALSTKLYDLNIKHVSDPDVSQQVSTYIQTGTNCQVLGGIPVGDLAVDSRITTNGVRKGYSFYFEVWSKGLKKETDSVRIIPKFYQLSRETDGSISIGGELRGFLQEKDRSWKDLADTANDELARLYPLFYEGEKLNNLGSHAQVEIPITLRELSGSSQVWKARYGIPAQTRFSADSNPDISEYKGEVLVCFELQAVKRGVVRYGYVQKKQWQKERDFYGNSDTSDYVQQEKAWFTGKNFWGSVIVYDASRSVEDEYTTAPTWDEN